MRKALAALLFCTLLPVFAQEAYGEAADSAYTFFDVVGNNGFAGLTTWAMIFALFALGFVLGPWSVWASVVTNAKQTPLVVKLSAYAPALASLGCLIHLFFLMVSGIVLHFRQKKLADGCHRRLYVGGL